MNRAGVTGVAERIAARRAERRLTLMEMAKKLEINVSWAMDLEHHDEELPTTISIGQVCRLAEFLSLSPRGLVCGDACTADLATVSPQEVVESIKAHLSTEQVSVDQFEDAVGWDVSSVIGDSAQIWSDWNLDQASDVCGAVGIDWRSLLPSSPGD